MITKNASKVYSVYVAYGRGNLSWNDAIAKLIALAVSPDKAAGVLLGNILIAGH